MGMGYLVVLGKDEAEKGIHILQQTGKEPQIIGEVVEGDGPIRYKGALNYGPSD